MASFINGQSYSNGKNSSYEDYDFDLDELNASYSMPLKTLSLDDYVIELKQSLREGWFDNR